MRYFLFYSLLFLVLLGCQTFPTSSVPLNSEPIYIPVIYAYTDEGKSFPGGWCQSVCVVMLAGWYHAFIPEAKQVENAQEFLISGSPRLYFLHIWHMDVRYRYWQLAEISQELHRGRPIIAYIDGWETMLHAILIIGIDSKYLYYHDPTLGPDKYMSHAQFQQIHRIGHYAVWKIHASQGSSNYL